MKKVLFRVPLILFIVISCWWMTYFPYNREMLYRAIPASADLIIEQPGLYDYFNEGLLRDLFLDEAGPFDEDGDNGLGELLNDKRLNIALKAVASKSTLVARVPSLSRSVKPAIVIASWAGSKGQLFKWTSASLLKSIAKHKQYHYGIDIWSIDLGSPVPGYRYFSFAFVEGVLVGCLSHQMFNADYIVDRMIFTMRLAPSLQKRLDSDGGADDGWISFQNAGVFGSQAFTHSFKSFDASSVTGRIAWQEENPFRLNSIMPDYGGQCREACKLLGLSPSAVAFAPYQFFERQMINSDSRGRLAVVRKLLRDNVKVDTPVFMSLCTPDFSGKLRGFKVPSLLMGLQVKDSARFAEVMSGALDELNASYRLNLIATDEMLNGNRIYNIDQVTGSFFKEMGDNEKPALCLLGNWLIVGSNSDVIQKLIEMEPAISPVSGIDFDKSMFAGWADIPSLREALVNIVAMNDLWSIAVQKNRNNSFRSTMSGLNRFLGSLKEMDTCLIMTDQEGDDTELNVEIK